MISKSPAVLAVGFVILALALVGLLAWGRSISERPDGITGPATGAETMTVLSIPPIDAAAPDTETATFALG